MMLSYPYLFTSQTLTMPFLIILTLSVTALKDLTIMNKHKMRLLKMHFTLAMAEVTCPEL
jgi:hypothetical protein